MNITANADTTKSFKNDLLHTFLMIDLKDIKLFLVFKLTRSNHKITLEQKAFVKTVLN